MIQAYHESLLSQLYPGQQHSSNCLIPAVLTFDQRLCLPSEHRAKVVWRLDRGFGGDENINWLLERDYQVLAKGCSHHRRNPFHPIPLWQLGLAVVSALVWITIMGWLCGRAFYEHIVVQSV